ncbi:hypothetical protein NQ318_005064 [Aromia moschata]|uniref:Uncharacterized protein n=1 Tax=Aromia moschata TaxID=1265417 RepID=A0AAV8YFT6_9CUCU|nr:hypothetical protein NQ318_005064 [Aromia moschata]
MLVIDFSCHFVQFHTGCLDIFRPSTVATKLLLQSYASARYPVEVTYQIVGYPYHRCCSRQMGSTRTIFCALLNYGTLSADSATRFQWTSLPPKPPGGGRAMKNRNFFRAPFTVYLLKCLKSLFYLV